MCWKDRSSIILFRLDTVCPRKCPFSFQWPSAPKIRARDNLQCGIIAPLFRFPGSELSWFPLAYRESPHIQKNLTDFINTFFRLFYKIFYIFVTKILLNILKIFRFFFRRIASEQLGLQPRQFFPAGFALLPAGMSSAEGNGVGKASRDLIQ